MNIAFTSAVHDHAYTKRTVQHRARCRPEVTLSPRSHQATNITNNYESTLNQLDSSRSAQLEDDEEEEHKLVIVVDHPEQNDTHHNSVPTTSERIVNEKEDEDNVIFVPRNRVQPRPPASKARSRAPIVCQTAVPAEQPQPPPFMTLPTPSDLVNRLKALEARNEEVDDEEEDDEEDDSTGSSGDLEYYPSRSEETLKQMAVDERRAERVLRQLALPYTAKEIVHMSIEEFNIILLKHALAEEQIEHLKAIRRRGKNKMAAKNCRKRKLDHLSDLSDELQALTDQYERKVQQQKELERIRGQAYAQLVRMQQFIVANEKRQLTLTNDTSAKAMVNKAIEAKAKKERVESFIKFKTLGAFSTKPNILILKNASSSGTSRLPSHTKQVPLLGLTKPSSSCASKSANP